MALLLTVEDKVQNPQLIYSERLRKQLVNVDPFMAFRECDSRFADKDIVQKMLYTDTQIILPDIFLEKVDRSTMAASIEVRVPFLDNELVDYVMSLPSALKIKAGVKKWLLKQALEGIVPADILHGAKTGFGVPYQYWLKGPLKDLFYDRVSQLENRGCDILDMKYIVGLMKEHLAGNRDHGFILWKVLNLMIWLGNKRV
jgi:asparagine synthase (glutamine-hydrolysing)